MGLNFTWKKFTDSPIFLSKHQAPPIGMCFFYGVRSNRGLRNRILSILLGSTSWGVDFALLDCHGKLLSNPLHYRDKCSEGMMEWVFQRVSRKTLFARTGNQSILLNGLYRLAYLAKMKNPVLEACDTFLTIADLFNYWLTGNKSCEYTHVTTQQL